MRTILCLLIAVVIGSACGGAGGSSGPSLQELAGSYSGTWAWEEGGPNGSITCQIGLDGTITGTITDSRWGSGIIGGSSLIRAGGSARITGNYDVGLPSQLLVVFDRGRLSFNGQGHLVGTLIEGMEILHPTRFVLVRQ